MKILKILFILSFIVILVGGCKKTRPPVDYYVATFHYDYPSWSVNEFYIKVTESNSQYLLIKSTDYDGNISNPTSYPDTLFKTEKELIGKIPPYVLIGKWSKKFLRKSYLIQGTFTQIDETQGGVFTYYGTFEIKTKH